MITIAFTAVVQRVMLLLDARHGFKKLDMEFLELLYDPKGPSPLGERVLAMPCRPTSGACACMQCGAVFGSVALLPSTGGRIYRRKIPPRDAVQLPCEGNAAQREGRRRRSGCARGVSCMRILLASCLAFCRRWTCSFSSFSSKYWRTSRKKIVIDRIVVAVPCKLLLQGNTGHQRSRSC